MKIVLSKSLSKRLDRLVSAKTQVVLLIGPAGSGKRQAACYLVEQIVDGSYERALEKGVIRLVDGHTSGIDEIRQLIKSVAIKSGDARVYIIQNMHNLGHEAQNALLKTLEQLPQATFFVMTTDSPSDVLATIRSRSTAVSIQPLSLTEAKRYYAEQDPAEVERYWRMSKGLAAQLDQLLRGDSTELSQAVEQAKNFLSLSAYDRLILLSSQDKTDLSLFITALSKVLGAASEVAATKDNRNLKRLLTARKQLLSLTKSLDANVSVKLIALQLALNLGV